MDEIGVRCLARQPEHELIEKQHDGVVAERLGMAADDLQTLVEFEKGLVLAVGLRAV